MALRWADWPNGVLETLRRGTVIPAHLLALDQNRRLDVRRQRALSRYYIDAGSGGLAVGVHATQFAIREAGLYDEVLRLAINTAAAWTKRPLVMIAGLAGRTAQASREATIAAGLGYHAGLLSLAAMKSASEDELVAHCRDIADVMPLVGFYLQTAVGGIALSENFWRRFAAIEQVVAIKIAPFDRYQTLDVVRGVVAAQAEDRVTLYTGNDDNIVLELVTPFAVRLGGAETERTCLFNLCEEPLDVPPAGWLIEFDVCRTYPGMNSTTWRHITNPDGTPRWLYPVSYTHLTLPTKA